MTTPTPPDAELLPCPFCGSKASVEVSDQGGWKMMMCTECTAQSGLVDWNTRAPSPELARLQSELSAALGKLAEVREWCGKQDSFEREDIPYSIAASEVERILDSQPADKEDSLGGDKARGE